MFKNSREKKQQLNKKLDNSNKYKNRRNKHFTFERLSTNFFYSEFYDYVKFMKNILRIPYLSKVHVFIYLM